MSNVKPDGSPKRAPNAPSGLAETQRKLRNLNRGNAEKADWANVSSDKLAAVVAVVSKNGCAVTFGLTRDGGAFTIRILGVDDIGTFYVRPTEDVELTLGWIYESFDQSGTVR